MLLILPEETDPYFCLAAEEYLLKNHCEEMILIWQCDDTVVVGKHQNALAEINYPYVREKGIRVARRISGGGTVFHDSGNVNFTFLKNISSPREISFPRFMEPVIGALAELGVSAQTSGRNDLLAGGNKISGNAEHVYKNRVLHHGTLLFDSDLLNLGRAIQTVTGKYHGKAVESNRSKVANISGFLSRPLTLRGFISHLAGYMKKHFPDLEDYQIHETEKEKIRILAEDKFAGKEWIFGYSPSYTFTRSVHIGDRELITELAIDRGIITTAGLSGSFYRPEEARLLETLLKGKYHLYESVQTAHQSMGLKADDEELIYSYF